MRASSPRWLEIEFGKFCHNIHGKCCAGRRDSGYADHDGPASSARRTRYVHRRCTLDGKFALAYSARMFGESTHDTGYAGHDGHDGHDGVPDAVPDDVHDLVQTQCSTRTATSYTATHITRPPLRTAPRATASTSVAAALR